MFTSIAHPIGVARLRCGPPVPCLSLYRATETVVAGILGGEFVDIGGGHGRTLAEILQRNPQMHGVLFDLPHALEGGRNTIAQAGLTERCEVAVGDLPVSRT